MADLLDHLLGVTLMAGEDLEAGLQQVLQFAVGGGRNEQLFDGAVDEAVIGDFVLRIGAVEGGAG